MLKDWLHENGTDCDEFGKCKGHRRLLSAHSELQVMKRIKNISGERRMKCLALKMRHRSLRE